jgi:ribosomal protein L11 methyltransferase
MAAKMGAAGVLAVDIDEAAVKTARENVLKNYECERIRVMRGVLADVPEQPFDLIYMNIIADVIISLSGDVRRYVREGSRVILSGIIKSRRDEVVSRYAECGFRLGEETAVGEWVAMLLYA